MRKLVALLVCIVTGLSYVVAQNSIEKSDKDCFRVDGCLEEPFTGKVYLSYVKDRLVNLDSVNLDHATRFSFERILSQADVYRVRTSPYRFDITILAEPGGVYQIRETGSAQEPRTEVMVVCGDEQLLYQQYCLAVQQTDTESQKLNERYGEALEKGDQASIEALQQEIGAFFKMREQKKLSYISSVPGTLTGVVLAGELLVDTYPELLQVYQCLDTVTYRHTYSYRNFIRKYKEAEAKWIQNRPAPDFVTTDIQGRKVSLSDFKGYYLLLDFWASWCRPCRIKAKELKKKMPELEKRGIRVCGINMDEKREQWEKATAEDDIVWTNTGDLKPFKENQIAAKYKVTQLPTLFLIDPQGMIVKQNPSVDDLLQLECVK